jgi:hypothetical protein
MALTWDQAKKEAIAAEKKSPGKFSLKKALKNASAMYKKQGGGDHSESHHSPLSVHKLAGGRRRRRRGTKKGTKKSSKKRHTRRNKRTRKH